MPDPQLVLLRHGETEWSRTGRHTGTSDIPLTALGEDQARAAGRTLAGRDFALTLCSPLLRARRTAELAGHADAVTDPHLAEWDYGPVEGRTADDVSREIGRDWLIFRDGVHVVPRAAAPGDVALVGGAGRRDDPTTSGRDELDEQLADTPGRRVDEGAGAGADRIRVGDEVVSRHALEDRGGGRLAAHAVGHGHQGRGGDHGGGRRAPQLHRPGDPVADGDVAHVGADR